MRGQQIARRKKLQRQEDKARKEALKSISDLKAEASRTFNAYIRERDLYKPCVSCGKSAYRGQRHCGHFYTRKARPDLTYNTFNCAAQCAQCNLYESGAISAYREELVRRIGIERVTRLEQVHEVEFTREYLVRLREIFRRRRNHLRKLRQIVKTDDF